MSKVDIYRIIKTTSGRMHAWCDSSVGIVRKEIKNIRFYKPPEVSPISETIKEPEKKWYEKVWIWIKGKLKKMILCH